MSHRSGIALHRFAVLTAVATSLLLFAGGLVTSTGSALAVPDWPLANGQLFPAMVGGVLYEHGHRLVAATVGLLTVVLALWTVVRERRPAVRALGTLMLFAVVLQGMLGGITVLYKLPLAVSVSHACLAQIFFSLAVAMALVTAPTWSGPLRFAAPVPALAAATTVAVFVQVALGALVRHTGAGLAIPDFPLAFGRLVPPMETPLIALHFAHRVGALIVGIFVVALATTVLRRHRNDARLVGLALLAVALLAIQIALGALILSTLRAVLPTTTHVVVGAALLATCVALTLTAACPRDVHPRRAPARRRAHHPVAA